LGSVGDYWDTPTAQNSRSGAARTTCWLIGTFRQIGGSARGYQGLSALLVTSTTDEQQAAQAVFLYMSSAGRECALLAAKKCTTDPAADREPVVFDLARYGGRQ
jgi:hypothetical protein